MNHEHITSVPQHRGRVLYTARSLRPIRARWRFRLAGTILAAATLCNAHGATANAVSGDVFGAPATCNTIGKACIYDGFNFTSRLLQFGGSLTYPSTLQYRDSSAYNRGNSGWDVQYRTFFNGDYGWYCLSPGRGWQNLSQKTDPSGWNYNNKGFAANWYQNWC